MQTTSFYHVVNAGGWSVPGIAVINRSEKPVAAIIDHILPDGTMRFEPVIIPARQRHSIPRPDAYTVEVTGPDSLLFQGYQYHSSGLQSISSAVVDTIYDRNIPGVLAWSTGPAWDYTGKCPYLYSKYMRTIQIIACAIFNDHGFKMNVKDASPISGTCQNHNWGGHDNKRSQDVGYYPTIQATYDCIWYLSDAGIRPIIDKTVADKLVPLYGQEVLQMVSVDKGQYGGHENHMHLNF